MASLLSCIDGSSSSVSISKVRRRRRRLVMSPRGVGRHGSVVGHHNHICSYFHQQAVVPLIVAGISSSYRVLFSFGRWQWQSIIHQSNIRRYPPSTISKSTLRMNNTLYTGGFGVKSGGQFFSTMNSCLGSFVHTPGGLGLMPMKKIDRIPTQPIIST